MKCGCDVFSPAAEREETGDRAIAIKVDNPVKPWACHVYECHKSGNLVGLCDLMKPGQNAGGRPRGERFKQIAEDLQAMAAGEQPKTASAPAAPHSQASVLKKSRR